MKVNVQSLGHADKQQGLNKYELLQSSDEAVNENYAASLDLLHGSLSYNADNDVASKFQIANAIFSLAEKQRKSLQLIGETLVGIDSSIDPPRLRFEIGMTSDDEIYISRMSSYGVNNILIYEDGTISHSFIGYKEAGKQDFLEFLEPIESVDFEKLLFKFFSYR